MRFGVLFEPNSNAFYRAIEPMRAMQRRGHDVMWPDQDGRARLKDLIGCDAVHIYRSANSETQTLLSELKRRGIPITYDNDDDFRTVPRESPDYTKVGGLAGQQIFAMTVKVAKLAHSFSTTNELLAGRYRDAGVERVEVIDNHLIADSPRPRHHHEGVVVGWIAGIDHQADVARIDISGALRRLVARYENVWVDCIGVNLRLPDRYRHDRFVPFSELPDRIGGFDIGIAPLAEIPVNMTRSAIKIKEYAASGVPWLASPLGPYRALGRAQGGLLIQDDGWFEALEDLVTHRFKRWRFGRAGMSWAKSQTIEAVADRWERLFTQDTE